MLSMLPIAAIRELKDRGDRLDGVGGTVEDADMEERSCDNAVMDAEDAALLGTAAGNVAAASGVPVLLATEGVDTEPATETL